MKIVKRIIVVVLSLLLILALIVGGYVGYMVLQYSRIPDFTPLDIENNNKATIQQGVEYTASTFNIGFGAYDHDFSFFMDRGTMLDGTEVQGKFGRAQSEEIVQTDTQGAIQQIQNLNPDFCFFQEVDQESHRSWKINQSEAIKNAFGEYAFVFSSNFHSAFLAYPLHEMHGSVKSGIVTLSRFGIDHSTRRSFPVTEEFPTKFFDLDRCFVVNRIPVDGGKELVLINLHMSAYDEGGLIRQEQLKMLNETMAEERNKGNWVVVGGDYNHALSNTIAAFPTQQKQPDWVFTLSKEDLTEGFHVVDAENAHQIATCRSSDVPCVTGVNYMTVLDGFIVSDNVQATAENINANFMYSDHNPVLLRFTLTSPEASPEEGGEEAPAEGEEAPAEE